MPGGSGAGEAEGAGGLARGAERDVLARRGDLDRDPEDGGRDAPHGLGLRAAADQQRLPARAHPGGHLVHGLQAASRLLDLELYLDPRGFDLLLAKFVL